MRLFSIMLVLDREEFDTFLIIKELFAGLPCPVFRLCSYDFVGFDHLRPVSVVTKFKLLQPDVLISSLYVMKIFLDCLI